MHHLADAAPFDNLLGLQMLGMVAKLPPLGDQYAVVAAGRDQRFGVSAVWESGFSHNIVLTRPDSAIRMAAAG